MTAVSDFAASTTSLVLAVSLSLGDIVWAASETSEPVRVEIFTGHNLPIQPAPRGDVASAPLMIEVYALDGIERFEAILSERLPTDPNAARRMALKRVRQVDAVRIEEAQRAAVGLVRVAEYGVDRYPAIVFNGHAVVYGVTEIGEALRHYRMWQGRVP
jgi:integrating conjugative element protein (TIGR03757 family)